MLKKLTVEEIEEILKEHKKWLNGEGGSRANFNNCNLDWASLEGASLNRASLEGASLNWASLNRASLDGASLNRASLEGASLNRASLNWASLNWASLNGASLNWASLERASLEGASLNGASLNWAKNADLAIAMTQIVPECGDFIGWKKCQSGVIIKLLIPSKAKRSNANGRKCRAEFVKVLQVYGAKEGISKHDKKTKYIKGQIVKCDKWDDNKFNECSGGIHFFISRIEAENYN